MTACHQAKLIFRVMVLAAGLLGSSLSASSDVPMAGDVAKAKVVWAQFEAWLDAYAKGDLDQVMSIFAKDVQFSFRGAPDQSYDQLRAGYIEDFKSRKPGAQWTPRVEEVYADGNLAFVRATWELVVTSTDGKHEVKERNRALDILRAQDGRWVIFRSMNYPES